MEQSSAAQEMRYPRIRKAAARPAPHCQRGQQQVHSQEDKDVGPEDDGAPQQQQEVSHGNCPAPSNQDLRAVA